MINLSGPAHVSVPTPHPQEPNHTCSADRGLLEQYRLSTVMSIIRKAYKPPPPSITGTEFVLLYDWRESCLLIGPICLHKSLCLPENWSKLAQKVI